MEKMTKVISNEDDALKFLNIALGHEWAVSFEYVIHAYSMPKGKFFYEDPVMELRTDIRAQTIQIGIDEMYHALQLGIVIGRMGEAASFKTDEVIRYPRIIDNLKRDKMTEDLVTDLYQSSKIREGLYPKIQNMALNISCDEVRHSRQFQAMIDALETAGGAEALCAQADPKIDSRDDVRLLHDIMREENELMHRYLKYVILFSEHQDLCQRLFKNSIDHMRHWDKNAGLLIKIGTVMHIENAEWAVGGEEKSGTPMPSVYPGDDRLSALETLPPAELDLIDKYERLMAIMPRGESHDQLELQLALKREHVFTQVRLLANARKIKGLI